MWLAALSFWLVLIWGTTLCSGDPPGFDTYPPDTFQRSVYRDATTRGESRAPPSFPHRCRREPDDMRTLKTPGSNGFGIFITNNPLKYVPGDIYTVSLQGQKANHVQKFTGFILVVEPRDPPNDIFSPPEVGSFQLVNKDLTKFSVECPHAISHTSTIHKSEVKVLWRAPPVGSGCVVFRATIIERRDVWRMDDDGLTKELCEEETASNDQLPEILEECKTCDEAKYEVTFEGIWSRHTHPKDYPSNEWLTHFSDIIGASHTGDYRIWDYGGFASEGVRHVAEWGSSKKLEAELKSQSDKLRTIIKARGLWYPNVNGKTFAVFRVDKKHHLMSLLSMIGPSPDWIVGVSGLELCLGNGSWTTEKVLNLYPWDAGTDSGVTYISKNAPTEPQDRIRRITSTNTNSVESPFFDPSGAPMKPLAKLTVTRQRLYEKSCTDTEVSDADHYATAPHESLDDDRPECQVTEWSEFTQCTATCGNGFKMRTRSYVNDVKARMMGCVNELVEKEQCDVQCIGGISCETNSWSSWSACSATCGKGYRSRARKYLNSMARKACHQETTEREMCMADIAECEQPEMIDPRCAVTQWSEWSPCPVTCGEGRRIRTRLYLSPTAITSCSVELMQKGPCKADRMDCAIDISEAKEICMQPKELSSCRGYFPRWYYDADKGMCLQFIYGGCRGNRNNFERYSDCNKMCELTLGALAPTHQPYHHKPQYIPQGVSSDTGLPINCMVTPWSDWAPCTRTCGNARKERRRMIKQNPQNGGKACPKRLVQRRKCKLNPPCVSEGHTKRAIDCTLSHWGEWMPCSKTCGEGGIQQRSREVRQQARNGGAPCGPKWERIYCVLPPCSFDF